MAEHIEWPSNRELAFVYIKQSITANVANSVVKRTRTRPDIKATLKKPWFPKSGTSPKVAAIIWAKGDDGGERSEKSSYVRLKKDQFEIMLLTMDSNEDTLPTTSEQNAVALENAMRDVAEYLEGESIIVRLDVVGRDLLADEANNPPYAGESFIYEMQVNE